MSITLLRLILNTDKQTVTNHISVISRTQIQQGENIQKFLLQGA
jgi:hypothetical protein